MHTWYALDIANKKTIFNFIFEKMIEIFILSLIQGIAEFLPVSSSSHLIIASDYLELEKNLSIDVSLHLGSFIAVIVYFYKDIINFYKDLDLFLVHR